MRNIPGILLILMIAMTATLLLLLSLGSNPPPAGAFCLSDYCSLDTIDNLIRSQLPQQQGRWNNIRIYYSGYREGNLNQIARLQDIKDPLYINCHFIICNGFGGRNGEIIPTYKWQKQWSANVKLPNSTWQTIEICVITNPLTSRPTDLQTRRTEGLVEQLCWEFDIPNTSIYYPPGWN